ncbi:MAG: 2-oxoacid:acceptor oxidoreductase subunit alpha [bacterium]
MVKKDDISIVLCGPAGQGIKTAEQVMVSIFRKAGYNVFATKEYMSRIRGGSNSTSIRVSSKQVKSFVDRMDILVPLDREALEHIESRITPETMVIGEKEILLKEDKKIDYQIHDVALTELAEEAGGKIYSNMIVVGIIAGLLDIDSSLVHTFVEEIFSNKEKEIVKKNISAIDKGYNLSSILAADSIIEIKTKDKNQIQKEFLVNGGEAVSMGAVAGGCNFIASYPMTPSTSVLTFLAQHGKKFTIIAEQAEDEIAAINMVLGAWYAGARGMVTTSGGGFALMTEGLSLSAMLESPLVIHLAQRPGPATGLPTRTEQGDLLFALHAGHGEFPRIIFSPGTLEDAFFLTQKAFNLADKYQIPVFILTDQYFIDSYYNIRKFDLSKVKNQHFIVKTGNDYQRYELTDNGVSPRGIPGYGDGLVAVDSDEHDYEGHITEDLEIRANMVEKRLKKMNSLVKEALVAERIGPDNSDTLVICWGSTVHIVKEALENIDADKIAVLYFKQVFPLSPQTADILNKAKKLIMVENNATAQFAQLLKLHLNIDISIKVLKYNGLCFSVEEVEKELQKVIN